ncbi:MAG: hypothetical protein AAF799_08635 [Myxococcota bacterium]
MALGGVSLGLACSAEPSPSDAAGSGDSGEANTSTDDGADETATVPTEDVDQAGVCARYIECVAAVDPAQVGQAVEQYGPEGSCWTPDTLAVCSQACIDARRNLWQLDLDEMACWDCRDDSECFGATCNLGSGLCGDKDDPPVEDLLTGTYLLALDSIVAPGLPFQFIAEVTTDFNDAGNGTAMFELQPLSLDVGSTDTPREEVGDPLLVMTEVADMTFELDLGMVQVTGAANPITGSDIELEAVLDGEVRSQAAWCGTLSGNVTSPIMASLEGSTFAAVRLADRSERPTVFPLSCADVDAMGLGGG